MKKLVLAGIYHTGNLEYVKAHPEVAFSGMSGATIGEMGEKNGEIPLAGAYRL
jgi:hypothetical protein